MLAICVSHEEQPFAALTPWYRETITIRDVNYPCLAFYFQEMKETLGPEQWLLQRNQIMEDAISGVDQDRLNDLLRQTGHAQLIFGKREAFDETCDEAIFAQILLKKRHNKKTNLLPPRFSCWMHEKNRDYFDRFKKWSTNNKMREFVRYASEREEYLLTINGISGFSHYLMNFTRLEELCEVIPAFRDPRMLMHFGAVHQLQTIILNGFAHLIPKNRINEVFAAVMAFDQLFEKPNTDIWFPYDHFKNHTKTLLEKPISIENKLAKRWLRLLLSSLCSIYHAGHLTIHSTETPTNPYHLIDHMSKFEKMENRMRKHGKKSDSILRKLARKANSIQEIIPVILSLLDKQRASVKLRNKHATFYDSIITQTYHYHCFVNEAMRINVERTMAMFDLSITRDHVCEWIIRFEAIYSCHQQIQDAKMPIPFRTFRKGVEHIIKSMDPVHKQTRFQLAEQWMPFITFHPIDWLNQKYDWTLSPRYDAINLLPRENLRSDENAD